MYIFHQEILELTIIQMFHNLIYYNNLLYHLIIDEDKIFYLINIDWIKFLLILI